MTTKAKRGLLLVAMAIFFLCGKWFWLSPSTPESAFRAQYADLWVGIPDYERFDAFTQPIDAIKGDFFTAEFSQSEPQLRKFASKLGVSQESILTSTGVWVTGDSQLNPKHRWILEVRAAVATSLTNSYKIHIEGRQPYD